MEGPRMEGPGMEKLEKARRPVEEAVLIIEERIGALQQSLETLQDRLGNVLGPEPMTSRGEGGDKTKAEHCKLAEILWESAERIKTLTELVNDGVIARLEI